MRLEALTDDGKKIWSLLEKFDDFYLAGGTALALQIGHRVSVDFDFFSNEKINKNLLSKVKRFFDGFDVRPTINNSDELTVFINDTKVTFLKYPFPVIDDFVKLGKINSLSIGEIAATKAYSIGRRGVYKDYVDLYFTILEGRDSLEDVIKKSDKKFGSEFNSRLFLEQLIFMDDIEYVDIRFLKEEVSKEVILNFFKNKIKELHLDDSEM
ncbi:MAG: nucleotidyl transferase AbiEii/AbiGii toxin family protein [Patescibacteria group bacterium]